MPALEPADLGQLCTAFSAGGEMQLDLATLLSRQVVVQVPGQCFGSHVRHGAGSRDPSAFTGYIERQMVHVLRQECSVHDRPAR